MSAGRWLRVGQLVISLALLFWVLRDDEIMGPLRQAGGLHWGWLALGLGWAVVMLALSGLRWWLLLRAQGIAAGWAKVAGCAAAGLLFDAVLPGAAGGDVARALLLKRTAGVPMVTGLVSLMVDHLSGLLALLLLAGGFTLGRRELLEGSAVGVAGLGYLWLYLIGGVATVMASFALSHPRLRPWVPQWMPGRKWLMKFAEAWHVYAQDWRRSLLALLVSLPMLVAHFSLFHAMLRAAGAPVAWGEVMTVMPVVEAAAVLPVSFGGLGLREALFAGVLGGAGNDGLLVLGGVLGHAGLAVCGLAGWLWSVSMRAHEQASAR